MVTIPHLLNSSLNTEENINQQFTQFVDKYFSFSKALAVSQETPTAILIRGYSGKDVIVAQAQDN
ncbi:hypothetical protein L2Z40_18715 (plasmid) [Acinetobacter baumannii]|nr:hypothetical protein [Acinetobacter baumannii]UVU36983.1 hypothetical protein L2Z40_18715 [Acinetobacter baumannii]